MTSEISDSESTTMGFETLLSHEYVIQVTAHNAMYAVDQLSVPFTDLMEKDPCTFAEFVSSFVYAFLKFEQSDKNKKATARFMKEGKDSCDWILSNVVRTSDEKELKTQEWNLKTFGADSDWEEPIDAAQQEQQYEIQSPHQNNQQQQQPESRLKQDFSWNNPPSLSLKLDLDSSHYKSEQEAFSSVWDNLCSHVFGTDISPKFSSRNIHRIDPTERGIILVSFVARPKRRYLIEFAELCRPKVEVDVLDCGGGNQSFDFFTPPQPTRKRKVGGLTNAFFRSPQSAFTSPTKRKRGILRRVSSSGHSPQRFEQKQNLCDSCQQPHQQYFYSPKGSHQDRLSRIEQQLGHLMTLLSEHYQFG